MLHFPSELHHLFSCPMFHISSFEGCRCAWASCLVIMTEVTEHRESQLKPAGVSEKVLTDWFWWYPCFLFKLWSRNWVYEKVSSTSCSEYRCEFGVLSLGGGDLWILQREVFYILTCVHNVGRLEKHWLSIRMKDKVLSLRWWERTQTEKCTQTEWALSCGEWWFTDVLTAYQVQLWQEQGSAPRETGGRHPNTSSPVFFLTPILFHWLHEFTADQYECYNLSPFLSSLPSVSKLV